MSSPLPPDPYTALGVSKDADISQIRTAHRKLVLKFHPDRIKGDDTEEKNKAKNEFQRVQQAYELLADASRRARYDNQIKLAELQKEKMMSRDASRPSMYTTQSTPAPSFVRREMRSDGNFYEERAPPTSYFDSRDRFDDPIPQTSARKHETSYEKEKERKPPTPRSSEKKEKFSAKMQSPVEGISMRMAFQAKAKATQIRERVRDGHAKNQETRDRERDRERSDKHSGRRAYAAEVESESDSDTVVQRSAPRSRRASPRTKQESEFVKSRPTTSRRSPHEYDDESFGEEEKWERIHKNSMDYITESQKRPALSRGVSDAHVFWNREPTGRKSGSDSEQKNAGSNSRRVRSDEPRMRPGMPVHSSAPSNLRPYVEERIPQRAQTNPYPADRDARPPASLNRSQTMPTNKSSKKDTAPTKGSNLRNETNPDSGYYSSSNPHTPDLKGFSPPPSRENSKKKNGNSTTKYQIVSPESDDDRASRVQILNSDEDSRRRRYRSPEPDRREKERNRERERESHRDRDRDRDDHERPRARERPVRTESDSRTRSTRAPAPTSYSRNEFRASPPVTRPKLFGEVSSDEKEAAPYSYPYDASRVKTAAYRPPLTTNYSSRTRDDDDHPGSNFREQMRYPHARKQPAAH